MYNPGGLFGSFYNLSVTNVRDPIDLLTEVMGIDSITDAWQVIAKEDIRKFTIVCINLTYAAFSGNLIGMVAGFGRQKDRRLVIDYAKTLEGEVLAGPISQPLPDRLSFSSYTKFFYIYVDWTYQDPQYWIFRRKLKDP